MSRAKLVSGEEGVALAASLLHQEEVVALPTETVYGLAGNAFSEVAVKKIFEAKQRPFFDPLIVHLGEASWLERVALPKKEEKELVEALVEAFWPGPLTLLLPKQKDLPDLVTAGSRAVAIRMPAHPLFLEVLRLFGLPLAAPSANRFGRISPTTASDVLEELGEVIPLILEGGATKHGVESTIVEVSAGELKILRPGPITATMLGKFAEVSYKDHQKVVPGSLPSHYAPSKPVGWWRPEMDARSPEELASIGLLAFSKEKEHFGALEVLSPSGSLEEAAANLYHSLRRLDQSFVSSLLVEPVPEKGIGVAIMDRLKRATYSGA